MLFKNYFLFCAILFSTNFLLAEPPSEKDIYEEYALSEKREEVLKKLVPGTEIYFFLHTLFFQQNNKNAEANAMLADWFKRFSYSAQYTIMKNRQVLLDFDKNPEATFNFIREHLGLDFNQGKPTSLAPLIYPSLLSPNVYNFETTFANILNDSHNLSGVTPAGLFEISKRKLSPEQLQILLKTYPHPDLPNMVGLIHQDFQNYTKRLFGDLSAHSKLTIAQLNELKEKMPNIIKHEKFIYEFLSRLTPSSVLPLSSKPHEFKKYLIDCWNFVKDLNPAFNSLKANILYSYLNVCLELNQPDFEIFKDFIKLPRQLYYANVPYYQKSNQANEFIQYQKTFNNSIQIPPLISDVKLIETYLYKLIQKSGDTAEIQQYFERYYFNKFEAETKIMTGLGKPEDFFTILQPTDLESIKNSIEITFTPQNKKNHLANDSVSLHLQLKNISELEVQIYKLNMLDFYRQNNREINQEISLEGYIPNITKKILYTQASIIKHDEQIDLPEINTAGVYIIELSGNGIKTRAFIRKGSLYPVIYEANSGHELQLFDDNQNKITEFTVYFGKHQLISNKAGVVTIPYTTAKNQEIKSLIFAHKENSCLYQFQHSQENYHLYQLILNQPESLIQGQNCKILIKPILRLNQKPVVLDMLKDSFILIKFFNNKNELLSSQTVKLEALNEIIEVASYIPETASYFNINLSSNITKKADNEPLVVSSNNKFVLSGANANRDILGLYLRKQNNEYQIECLNKAGMPQANISINISLQHQYFTTPFYANLQTNANGMVFLKDIPLIQQISATAFNGPSATWFLPLIYTSRPTTLTSLEKEHLEIPFTIKDPKKLNESVLLLKRNGHINLENITNQLSVENDLLKIPTEVAGDYTLILKEEGTTIQIRILKGKKQGHYLVSDESINDIPAYLSHQISIEQANQKEGIIKGKIINPHENMRVLLWPGRYFSNQPYFLEKKPNYLFQWPSHQRNLDYKSDYYFDSITLSSEQKYIGGRKKIKNFPGNLLATPSSILNPWDTAIANTRLEDELINGGTLKKRSILSGGGSRKSDKESLYESFSVSNDDGIVSKSNGCSLEFFANSSVLEIPVLKDGSFEINLKDLNDQTYLQMGVISPYGFVIKELPLAKKETKLLDIRKQKPNSALEDMLPALTMAPIQADKPMNFMLGEEKRVFKIDTISKLHATFLEIIDNEKLKSFNFLGKWSTLSEDQKLKKYTEFACHELHLFIYLKDKDFFTKHISAFLKNKQFKTFIDHWLLDADLSNYLNLNEFNQLNLFEKILLAKKHPSLKEKLKLQINEHLELFKPNRENEIKIMEKLLNGEQSNKEVLTLQENSIESKKESFKGDDRSEPTKPERKMALAPMEKSLNQAKSKDSQYLRKQEESLSQTTEGISYEYIPIELYRDVKDTKEYVEANYYNLERKNERSDLIQPNQFWLDMINNSSSTFVSSNFLSFSNINECLLAMAVMDLPEKSESLEPDIKGNQITITNKTPCIVLLKSFKNGTLKTGDLSLQQHYFLEVDNEKKILDANKKPFLVNKKYNCLTVITNTTSEIKEFYINLLIPEGSLPLDYTLKNKIEFIIIQPFTSYVIENQFFFPKSGSYSHLPAKAMDYQNIFTNEKMFTLTATADEDALDKDSWEFVVKEGNKEKILTFIKTHNLLKTRISDIYYLLKEKDFFESLASELKSRYYFDYVVWSFSVFHKDKVALTEFLANSSLINSCGTYFSSPLLQIDPLVKRVYEHKEYYPLVKGRSHQMSSNNKFENAQLESHYLQFIDFLLFKSNLNNSDYLNLTIYSLNQLSIEKALAYFSKIKESDIIEKLQYDYLKAYLAFYQEDLTAAEKILLKYKDINIVQWKEKYAELEIQLAEIKTGKIDEKARGAKFNSTALAEKETMLKATNNQGKIEVVYKNLNQGKADFYLTDLEILFSNSPFGVMNNQFHFLTSPNYSEPITLNEKEEKYALIIPEHLKNKNLVIKISGAGKESIVNYYPSQMEVTISENYGELRVISTESKKPLSGIYVKVYGSQQSMAESMKDNSNDFIKDGYTDLRGVFNYTSVSGKPIKSFKTLALLILSETHGASVHYTAPPTQ